MRKIGSEVVYSASDIMHFLECKHLTALDRIHLETPLPVAEEDPTNKLIQQAGMKHEGAYLRSLIDAGKTVLDLGADSDDLNTRVEATREALASGAQVVYQGALRDGFFAGYSDFLERVETPSALGDFSYEVIDTKLARSPKAKFLVQLAFYSLLLEALQGKLPEAMHVVLGTGERVSYRVADYVRYFHELRERFLDSQVSSEPTYPIPCKKCGECRWIDLCDAVWERDDHLSRVANIRQSQVKKLEAANINTVEALATLEAHVAIPKLAMETVQALRQQANLQYRSRLSGERFVELLPIDPLRARGFKRLPPPNAGDLYFDMEGDPLEDGGLEYLFGVGYRSGYGMTFQPFWAHTRTEERCAFEAFIDFVVDHLARHPGAHIYHYANYEKAALGRLMSLHGTREREVDDLFRRGRLVDLYRVVKEGLRVSEPSYSIKNIERFYRPARSGDVQDAGASIVFYEQWRQTGEKLLLDQIEAYNRDDVESTLGLHDWLLGLRPSEVPWNEVAANEPHAEATAKILEESTEDRIARLRFALEEAADLPERERSVRVLAAQLLDFHRREQKPQWWKHFECLQMDLQELIEDRECLGGLTAHPTIQPIPIKRSMLHTLCVPEQESRLRTGSTPIRSDNGEAIVLERFDEQTRTLQLKLGPSADPLPDVLGLVPDVPINDKLLRRRIEEFGESLLKSDSDEHRALQRLLGRELPVVRGAQSGSALVEEDAPIEAISSLVANLDQSHLVVQGPPGAGKTYTGSHVIVDLIRRGHTVGVASNSHKAIHNLLSGVVRVADEQGVAFKGFKKTSTSNPDSRFESERFDNDSQIRNYDPSRHKIFAGTAWAFAALDEGIKVDFLFVDEAGQVSLGNLVAMGVRASNIVLLGDQMQLAQPIQGTHPGRSGDSALDYLLDGRPTIPPDEGVFLASSWRMHPDVCRFISEAVYEGRLHSAGPALDRKLILNARAEPELRPTGLVFVESSHTGRSQSSEEEAEVVRRLFHSLLEQEIDDGGGFLRPMGLDDILVVSPYNLQVNLLARTLPTGARVGTVDKFQGQEAAAVIVSMATSSSEELPRDIEFLFSKNRLNVGISRAQCLALVVASRDLLTVPCSTPEQMGLVNTLCWVQQYSKSSCP